jgi:homeobox-leucine zipper protein
MEVEEGDEGSGGHREDTADISSENSGPLRSRSDDDFDGEGEHDDEGDGDKNKKKKRKKYHRHTAEQIREMES